MSIFDESVIERTLSREEWVLHEDTGPGEPDRFKEEALESLLRPFRMRRFHRPRVSPLAWWGFGG